MRYFRTGEYRAPKAKEWFEAKDDGTPIQAEWTNPTACWILRAVDDEAATGFRYTTSEERWARLRAERDEWRDKAIQHISKLDAAERELSKLRALCGDVYKWFKQDYDLEGQAYHDFVALIGNAAKGEHS